MTRHQDRVATTAGQSKSRRSYPRRVPTAVHSLILLQVLILWGAPAVDGLAPLAPAGARRSPRRVFGSGFCGSGGGAAFWDIMPLRATIYAPSSWDDGRVYRFSDDEEPSSFDAPAASSSPLASLVSSRENAAAALARVAAAFGGSQGHHLDLRHIEHVEVRAVDGSHLDLEAVICENDGCVTVAVPVQFPIPCGGGDGIMEECVLRNVDELDGRATELLRELEWEEVHHEEVAAAQRELRVLQDSGGDLRYPEWWVVPPLGAAGDALRAECESVRRLLNEAEFASDVRDLAAQFLASVGGDEHDDWEVQRAAVAAAGPAGLLLRASVREIVLFDAEPRTQVLQVPVAFPRAADTADGLRSAVLAAITAASGFSDLYY